MRRSVLPAPVTGAGVSTTTVAGPAAGASSAAATVSGPPAVSGPLSGGGHVVRGSAAFRQAEPVVKPTLSADLPQAQ